MLACGFFAVWVSLGARVQVEARRIASNGEVARGDPLASRFGRRPSEPADQLAVNRQRGYRRGSRATEILSPCEPQKLRLYTIQSLFPSHFLLAKDRQTVRRL